LADGRIWLSWDWLHLGGEAEELEGAGLDWGHFGIEHEGCLGVIGHGHGVVGEGGEVVEEGAEAVHREAVVGALGRGLSACGGGASGGSDDGGARGLGGGLVVVVEEDGSEGLAHVPFEVVGEHAQQDMGADAVGAAMVDGADLEIDGLMAAEGALDPGELLVAGDNAGGVEGRGGEAGAQDVDAVERSTTRSSSAMAMAKCLAIL